MSVATTLRTVPYPLTIRFKTDQMTAWTEDMSQYVQGLRVDERVEDTPFTFIENDLRIQYWDQDNGFIQQEWNTDTASIAVEIADSEGDPIFAGKANVSSGVDKRTALSIDEKTNRGSLYFSSGIEDYNYQVEFLRILGRDALLLEAVSGQIWYLFSERLDAILDYFFQDTIDYSEMPFFNSSGTCYYYVDFQYFKANATTTLDFIKKVAEVFDAYIYYDPHTQKIYLLPREADTAQPTPLDTRKFEVSYEGRAPEYSGVQWSYTPLDSDAGTEAPQLVIYDKAGAYVRAETKNLENPSAFTILVGNTRGDVLTLDTALLAYLYTKTTTAPSEIAGVTYPSTYLRSLRNVALVNAAIKHLKPSVVVTATQKNILPRVGAIFGIRIDENRGTGKAGYVTGIEYRRQPNEAGNALNERTEITWQQVLSYTSDADVSQFAQE